MIKKSHEQLKKSALRRPGVKKEYDALADEFALFEEMIKARLRSGKTQEEVAKAMKTSTSVVGRLETGGGVRRHSPTLDTLRKYAKAIGCELQIKLIYVK